MDAGRHSVDLTEMVSSSMLTFWSFANGGKQGIRAPVQAASQGPGPILKQEFSAKL